MCHPGQSTRGSTAKKSLRVNGKASCTSCGGLPSSGRRLRRRNSLCSPKSLPKPGQCGKRGGVEPESTCRLPTPGGRDTAHGTRKTEVPWNPDRDNSRSGFSFSEHQSSSSSVSQAERGVRATDPVFEPENPPANSRSEPNSLLLERRGVTSHPAQALMWEKEVLFRDSILARLRAVGKLQLAGKMSECHTVETWKRCNNCRKATRFFNRCELFFCPICAPRLSRERKESIEWWTKQVNQPKHVVLTVRNTADLTKLYVQFLKDQLGKLRRQKVFRAVRGGFYSVELTNEGRGWHVHFHLLVDANWIDARELSLTWGKLVGQDYAIVKVKDCRSGDYLREVTKYAVKGAELARWSGAEVATFIESFSGVRFFGVFGSLYGKRTEWAEWIRAVRAVKPVCSCGCDTWRLLSPEELLWEEETGAGLTGTPPPSKQQVPNNQVDLPLDGTLTMVWPD